MSIEEVRGGEVVKGEKVWMQLQVGRCLKGMVIWAKAIPEVEEFMAELSIQHEDQVAPQALPNRRGGARPAQPWDGLVPPAPQVQPQVRLGEIQVDELISTYGGRWRPFDPEEKLMIYKNSYGNFDNPYYNLDKVGGIIHPNGDVNLSFLRIQGISKPNGIKFVVLGPIGRNDARNISTRILAYAKQFFTDYIAPFTINLRISSTEV